MISSNSGPCFCAWSVCKVTVPPLTGSFQPENKGIQWWLLARCSFYPILITTSALMAVGKGTWISKGVYYARCSQTEEFPNLIFPITFPTIVLPTQIWVGPIPNPTSPRPLSLTSILPFPPSMDLLPCAYPWCPPPAHFLCSSSTLIDHFSDEARGHLFALTIEYSRASMIDAVQQILLINTYWIKPPSLFYRQEIRKLWGWIESPSHSLVCSRIGIQSPHLLIPKLFLPIGTSPLLATKHTLLNSDHPPVPVPPLKPGHLIHLESTAQTTLSIANGVQTEGLRS